MKPREGTLHFRTFQRIFGNLDALDNVKFFHVWINNGLAYGKANEAIYLDKGVLVENGEPLRGIGSPNLIMVILVKELNHISIYNQAIGRTWNTCHNEKYDYHASLIDPLSLRKEDLTLPMCFVTSILGV